MQRFGDLAGHEIGIDIISFAFASGAHGSDDRNKLVLVERLDNQRIDADDLADHADIDDLGRGAVFRYGNAHFARQDQPAVFAAEADGHPAVLIDQGDDLFVQLADQHHFDNIQSLAIGDAHAAHETARDAHFVEYLVDLWAAAVHHDRIDADIFEQHDVLGKARFEVLVDHG